MNINNVNEVKQYYETFQQLFDAGKKEEARQMMQELLEQLETQNVVRKAGSVDKHDVIAIGAEIEAQSLRETDDEKDSAPIYISLNHVMEYYIYAYYFKPDTEVLCTDLPFGEYYRTYGALCMELGKYHAAREAYIHAIEWNPVDLDSILGLAECYKYLEKLERYIAVTAQAYRYCCTRATMARYYRNVGYYHLSKYKTDLARACYIYSNIYYKTDNAEGELKYLEQAIGDKTPEMTIQQMQKMFDENGIEPGPESDTIGVVYRVGQLMMQDGDTKLAKDCFSIVYDITQEEALAKLLDEVDERTD